MATTFFFVPLFFPLYLISQIVGWLSISLCRTLYHSWGMYLWNWMRNQSLKREDLSWNICHNILHTLRISVHVIHSWVWVKTQPVYAECVISCKPLLFIKKLLFFCYLSCTLIFVLYIVLHVCNNDAKKKNHSLECDSISHRTCLN